MTACVYDSPKTMCRECWQDGHLLYSYSCALLFDKLPVPGRYYFFGANIGDWKEGQVVGDRSAMVKPGNKND